MGVLGQPPGDVVVGEVEVQLCEADGAGHGGRRRTSPLQEEEGGEEQLCEAGGAAHGEHHRQEPTAGGEE